MKSTQYSEKVLDHFRNPRNVGTLEGNDVAVGRVGNPVCGDLMEIYIKVKDDRIEDIKFKTFGCGSAIATASMISELAKGKTIDEALKITRKDVADELDGLPPIKMHCSNLAADALKDAIKNYQSKQSPDIVVSERTVEQKELITGAEKFLHKGVYYSLDDHSHFQGKRTMVLDAGKTSIEIALSLIKHSSRVIFITLLKETEFITELKNQLTKAGVKMLYESKVIEISGLKEVEKVRIHNLSENEEYELFIDAIIIAS